MYIYIFIYLFIRAKRVSVSAVFLLHRHHAAAACNQMCFHRYAGRQLKLTRCGNESVEIMPLVAWASRPGKCWRVTTPEAVEWYKLPDYQQDLV
jgi:hypothetical protein